MTFKVINMCLSFFFYTHKTIKHTQKHVLTVFLHLSLPPPSKAHMHSPTFSGSVENSTVTTSAPATLFSCDLCVCVFSFVSMCVKPEADDRKLRRRWRRRRRKRRRE